VARAADIAVVIPTRERWPVLRRTLEALASQKLDGASMEVVVVDNGSRDGSLERLRSFAGVRVVEQPLPGAAAARNRGIADATAPLVLFLGDDCVPVGEGFVRGHLEAHARGVTRAVVGDIDWDPSLPRTEVMDWLERAGHMVDAARLRAGPASPETFYTGNVSLPRSALLEVAGFDQRFAGYGFEDLDLGLRLADRGLAFEHRPELVVHHAHSYGFAGSIARMEAVGRGARLLQRLHDHRRPLPGPPAGRRRLAAGLALGRMRGVAPPRVLPRGAREGWLRAAHLAAFARGYVAPPLEDAARLRGYGAVPRFTDEPRGSVSVVVPFLGNDEEARAGVAALERLELGAGDEAILVDNGGGLAPSAVSGSGLTLVAATAERSSYHARNAGAARARGDWLLFLDADTRPPPGLLDAYFREPIDERCGAVAGGVVAARGQRALLARYAASRRYLSQAAHFRDHHRPYGITANLLVRRAAFEEIGGFVEGIRSGGDADFSWRLQDAGWTIAYREPAAVEHLHRERLVPLLRQMARYSAAIAWMDRRLPGSSPRPPVVRRLGRAAAASAVWLAAGRPRRSLFSAIDGLVVIAEAVGWLMKNDAR
jgi:GT2 family glycosyltransferase